MSERIQRLPLIVGLMVTLGGLTIVGLSSSYMQMQPRLTPIIAAGTDAVALRHALERAEKSMELMRQDFNKTLSEMKSHMKTVLARAAAEPAVGGTLPEIKTAMRGTVPAAIPILNGASNNAIKFTEHRFTHVQSYIINEILNRTKLLGTFVEFGCADGWIGSNSYPFERMGWEGLCIEPNVPNYIKAKKIRKYTENALITPRPEKFTYMTFVGPGGCEQMSGIEEFYSKEYRDAAAKCETMGRFKGRTTVMGQPLPTLLDKYGMKQVTWMSIDCEGCEGPFITTFNFTHYDVQLLNYEENTAAKKMRAEIDVALASHGFQEVNKNLGDRMFMRKSLVITPGPHTVA